MSFYQTPQWRILFFVFLSMAAAVFYHSWKNQKVSLSEVTGSIEFASLSEPKMNREVKKCQCVLPGKESLSLLHLESIEKCPMLEVDTSAWPPLYRLERSKKPAEFPGLCLLPSMQKWGSAHFSCIHNEYLNVVYNFLGDLTECLDVPQKEFLNVLSSPKTPPTLNLDQWELAKTKIFSLTTPYCRQVQSVLNIVDKDSELKILTIQIWHFQNTLGQVRQLASQTVISSPLPEQWEEWVLARALEVGATKTFADIQNSKIVSSRKIASGPSSENAQELIDRWSQSAYVQSLIGTRQNFDEIFKEGTCVPESFLRH